MLHSKVIIGFTGEMRAGKGTFSDMLAAHLTALYNVPVYRLTFSTPLRESLAHQGREITRENLQREAQAWEWAWGKGALAHTVAHRMRMAHEPIALIDGARWQGDEEMVRAFPTNFLGYITAPENVRYERDKICRIKEGQPPITIEQFRELNQAPNEVYIPTMGSHADFTFDNRQLVLGHGLSDMGSNEFISTALPAFLMNAVHRCAEEYIFPLLKKEGLVADTGNGSDYFGG